MSIFDPSQGPVTVRLAENGVAFEVYQAFQGETALGAVRYDWTRSGIILETVSGHGHAAYSPFLLKRFNAALAYTGRTTQLVDFWSMPAYDSAFRLEHTQWGVKHRPVVDAVHILTQSKLVAMGVSVANLAMGGIFTGYTKRADFDEVVRKLGIISKRTMPQ